ncbi:PorT family protein, partial [Prevotella denticola]|nr:PorT family protein [Prevotella denticola]MBW4760830.1 PorT family protein [Prevotella denticola]
MSVTTGLDKILVPEDYYSNYSFKDKWQLTPTVGVFAQYHVDGSI